MEQVQKLRAQGELITMGHQSFVWADDEYQWQARAYQDANKRVVLSSRMSPSAYPVGVPLGTYKVNTSPYSFGHDVSELVELDISRLVETEDVMQGRWDDVLRYADWLREGGHTHPPIEVVEHRDGRLLVTDGHRRVASYKLLHRPVILAWVSWSFRPMGWIGKVGLTLEQAICEERLDSSAMWLIQGRWCRDGWSWSKWLDRCIKGEAAVPEEHYDMYQLVNERARARQLAKQRRGPARPA